MNRGEKNEDMVKQASMDVCESWNMWTFKYEYIFIIETLQFIFDNLLLNIYEVGCVLIIRELARDALKIDCY